MFNYTYIIKYYMSDSTAIDSLPMDNNVNMSVSNTPVQQGSGTNTINSTSQTQPEQPAIVNQPAIAPPKINNTIDTALNDMQSTTQLPSRDIPMETANIVQDEQVKPNYIPNQNVPEYIEEKDTYDSMIEQNKKNQNVQDTTEQIYEELQFPILVSVVYFLFQLPAVQKKFVTYLPRLFERDGSMSLGGYLTKSISFGGIIYLALKITKQLSNL